MNSFESNLVAIAELKDVLINMIQNNTDSQSLEEQILIGEAIGILCAASTDINLVDFEGVLINPLYVDRYKELMLKINSLSCKNKRN